MSIVMKTTVSTGASSGTVTRRKTCHSVAAVGPRRLEHVARDRGQAGGDHDHGEAGPDPDVGDDDRRRDQLRAEPGDAVERLGERLRADRDAGTRRPRRPRRRTSRSARSSRSRPSRRRRRGARRSRPAGRARPASTSPGVPPPGLKSRQTTPVMPPCSGSGRTACSAPSGTSSARIAVSPSGATSPGCERLLRASSPPCARPVRSSVDGLRLRAARPAGRRRPCTTAIAALTAPWSGSCWYMMRQVTPAAKAEIAIGMKTAVLNATDQRTRSVSTAKMSPIAVTSAGTTRTQIALFLIAVTRLSLVKSRLVVVEPDELVAALRRRSCGRSCGSSGRRSRRRGRARPARGSPAASACFRQRPGSADGGAPWAGAPL